MQAPLQPEAAPSKAAPAEAPQPSAIHIGLPSAGHPGATLDLAALRRHVAIFAGSGSGKTVLLRRVIEECALQGVSSIVLDPNNDLARLGDQWPAPPEPWLSDDPERSARYLAETDVVVWTPRRASGRPLAFRPLPDFGAVIDEVDEFDAAVDAAVEALAPRVGAQRATARATQEKAVLTEAMRYFASTGHDLGAFIDLLSTLPAHVSGQTRAISIARRPGGPAASRPGNRPALRRHRRACRSGPAAHAAARQTGQDQRDQHGRPGRTRRSGRASSTSFRWPCSPGSSATRPTTSR